MTAAAVPRPSLTRSSASGRRRAANAVAHLCIVLAFVVTVIPLALVVGYVVARGMQIMSWSFLSSDIPIVTRAPGDGMGPAVVGTLLITGAAMLMAVPLGILGGVYLCEYGGTGQIGRAHV